MAADSGHVLEVAAAVTGARDGDRRGDHGAVLLQAQLGAFLPLASLVRIAIATVAAFAVGQFASLPSTAS